MKLFTIITVVLPLSAVARPSGVLQSRGLIRRWPTNPESSRLPLTSSSHIPLWPGQPMDVIGVPGRGGDGDGDGDGDPRIRVVHAYDDTVRPSDTYLTSSQHAPVQEQPILSGDVDPPQLLTDPENHHPSLQSSSSQQPPSAHPGHDGQRDNQSGPSSRPAHGKEPRISPGHVDAGSIWRPGTKAEILRAIPATGLLRWEITELGDIANAWWLAYGKIMEAQQNPDIKIEGKPTVALTSAAKKWAKRAGKHGMRLLPDSLALGFLGKYYAQHHDEYRKRSRETYAIGKQRKSQVKHRIG